MYTDHAKALLCLVLVVVLVAGAAASAGAEEAPQHRYTFAWPYAHGRDNAPRGGTTRGPAVELVTAPTASWQALRAAGIGEHERDRRAILAMAGTYRATFDFLETVRFGVDSVPPRPYQSWGTELVRVVEDRGGFISLQHVLVMLVADDDGGLSGPHVMKHWRQDWQYEDTSLLEYRGHGEWRHREVAPADARGSWSQAVFQVDDFVRYEALGRWRHEGNYSAWTSEETWRPLPRREHSVRDDYDVLVGVNRHTILPTGWVHEQNNRKLALEAPGRPRHDAPWIARELGVNRYERIENFDFSAGELYWTRTADFWRDVRSVWRDRFESYERFAHATGDGIAAPYETLFEHADRIARSGDYDAAESRPLIEAVVDAYLIELAP